MRALYSAPFAFVTRRVLVAAAILLNAFVPQAAAAQCTIGNNGNGATCPGTPVTTLSMAVGKVTRLTLSATTLNLINGDANSADYEAGSKLAGSIAATAFSNSSFNVTISAATPNFSSAPSGVTKNASTVQFSLDGGTSWAGLSTSGATVIPTTAASSGTAKSVSFRTLLGWTTDPPGLYAITVNFTITAP